MHLNLLSSQNGFLPSPKKDLSTIISGLEGYESTIPTNWHRFIHMKIIIAAVTLFALLAPEASADHATRALRVLKGMTKEGKKGGMKGGKSQQCPAEKPPLFVPQCEEESKAKSIRFSTFNGSLYRPNEGDLMRELASPGSAQPDIIATIIQKVRPDVLLINEFDYDEDDVSLKLFMSNYLGVAHEGSKCSVVMVNRSLSCRL
jgi:hypothetical protein